MKELDFIEIEVVAGGRPFWLFALEAAYEFSHGFIEGVRESMPK